MIDVRYVKNVPFPTLQSVTRGYPPPPFPGGYPLGDLGDAAGYIQQQAETGQDPRPTWLKAMDPDATLTGRMLTEIQSGESGCTVWSECRRVSSNSGDVLFIPTCNAEPNMTTPKGRQFWQGMKDGIVSSFDQPELEVSNWQETHIFELWVNSIKVAWRNIALGRTDDVDVPCRDVAETANGAAVGFMDTIKANAVPIGIAALVALYLYKSNQEGA